MIEVREYILRHKLVLACASVISIIHAVVNVLIAFILSGMINAAMERDVASLKMYTLFSVMYVSTVLVIGTIDNYLQQLFTQKVMKEIRYDSFHALLNQDYQTFNGKPVGEYISLLTNDMDAIESSYIEALFSIVNSIATFSVALVSLIYINYLIILFVLLVGGIYILITSVLSNRITQYKDIWFRSLENYTTRIKELLSGYEVISNFDLAETIEKSFCTVNEDESNRKRNFTVKMENLGVINLALGQGLILAILAIGAILVIIDRLLLGDLIAVAQLLINLVTPVVGLVSCLNEMKSSQNIKQQIIRLVNGSSENWQSTGFEITDFRDKIEFQNVSFSYTGTDQVLSDISFVIRKNKKYAIIGPSGSGKSTLCKLVMNYFNQYEGKILLDGHDYREISDECFSHLFSITQQNIFLFDGTIKDNITLFGEFDLEQINEAIQVAGLQELFIHTGLTLNSVITENGSQLSGGERQRIAIARSYLMGRSILIFDEATSALDKEIANEILTGILKNSNLTCVTITHKINEVDQSLYDEIWEIRDGRINNVLSYEYL